jgi:hypothetical protein
MKNICSAQNTVLLLYFGNKTGTAGLSAIGIKYVLPLSHIKEEMKN